MKRAVIFSNGEFRDYNYYKSIISDNDYVICADGGIVHCLATGITPDLWVGDFDSCDFSKIMNDNPELSKIEKRKNRRSDSTCRTSR